jgi:DNA-binding MarR family transcriptional regulator
VHRRLKTLRAKGMITLVNDQIDSRTKYVMPTVLANQCFDQLGQCMDAANQA